MRMELDGGQRDGSNMNRRRGEDGTDDASEVGVFGVVVSKFGMVVERAFEGINGLVPHALPRLVSAIAS